MLRQFVIAACLWSVSLTAFAHPADISYLRVKVERQQLELRFTFNLLTLTRFVAIDGNGDKRIDKAELDAAEPGLRRYLTDHIRVRINDQPASLGLPNPLACLWPSPDTAPQAAEEEYAQRHVDVVFTQEVQPLLADVWLGFEIWAHTGPLGTIEATYEQDQMRTHVPFSQSEPDYLHDTGFIAAPPPVLDPFEPPAPPNRMLLIASAGLAGLAAAVVAIWRMKR
jgi:hypothetical protein